MIKLPRILFLLSLLGLGVSIWGSVHFYDLRSGSGAFHSFCNRGATFNCDAVAASPYAELFAGLPLSSFAAGWYLALAIVALVMMRNRFWYRDALRVATAMTGFAALMTLPYLAIMAWKLKTWCLLCLATDSINFASLGVVLAMRPEGFSVHAFDRKRLRLFAILIASSLLASVWGLRSLDASGISSTELQERLDALLSQPTENIPTLPHLASIGPADARVTIVEFSDFQCPFCRTGALLVNAVLERYPNQVRLIFRNFPLDPTCNPKMQRPLHPVACDAARVAYCSHQQGKFKEVYETLFERQTQLASTGMGRPNEIAHELGVNAEVLSTCMGSSDVAQAIAQDIAEADRLKVQSTPTFYINGKKMEGAYPLPFWIALIDKLLK